MRPKRHGRAEHLKRWGHLPVGRWIRKLRMQGKEYEIVVLATCTDNNDLNETEMFYITYFRSIGMQLLNCTDGGDGSLNPSPETRAKMSAASKKRWPESAKKFSGLGRVPSLETREKIAAKKRGISRSLEVRQKISATRLQRGYKISAEMRVQIATKLKDRIFTADHREKLRFAQRRRQRPWLRINLLSKELP